MKLSKDCSRPSCRGLLVAGTVAAIAQIRGGSGRPDRERGRRGRTPARASNYRTLYEALGSWADGRRQQQRLEGNARRLRSPGAIDAYRKTGHFREGAVLVKEVFATSTNEMTTGTVSKPRRRAQGLSRHGERRQEELTPATRCGATGGDGHGSTRTAAQTTSTDTIPIARAATYQPRPPIGFT